MSEVIIKCCEDYEYDTLYSKVHDMLDKSGLEIKPGMNVLIKANLLAKKLPQQCVTTNPNVIRAVCQYIKDKKAVPIIADSPAGPFNENSLKAIYAATGMEEAALQTGAILNYDTSFSNVKLKDAKTLDKIDVINAVLNAHMIINVAKLKTHVMMTYTGAVKNLYGVIPGLTKASYHMKLQQPENFSNHLIDICEFVKPNFSIIDGIHAMEGDGPNSGEKVEFGYILGSTDPYSLDLTASEMIGIDEDEIATIVNSRKRRLIKEDDLEVLVETDEGLLTLDFQEFKSYIRNLGLKPFKKPKAQSVNFLSGKVPKFIERYIVDKSKSKPYFIEEKCIGCGHCVRNCPAKIIHLENKKAIVDIGKCISCFCCHEVCPKDAVEIRVPFIAKLLFREKS